MGCTTSKLDDLPAVALCRDRSHFLQEAIHQRYALAAAHVAYIQSLKGIGVSLHRFFDQDPDVSTAPPSPLLHLPTQRKGDSVVTTTDASGSLPAPAAVAYHSRSSSASHLHFHSDSEDGDLGSVHHYGNSSPLNSHGHRDYYENETLASFPGEFTTMNYMRNRATPSVVHEQRPMIPETVQMGDSYPNYNPSSYQYYGYSNYGGGINGYVGSSSPPPPPEAPSSKPPPAPPSPPRNSAWDFLNLFETFERDHPPYTPSRDWKVREEEGIPALEENQHEVVKEVHEDQKFVNGYKMAADGKERGNAEEALYQTRSSVPEEKEAVEYEVHVVDKNVVVNEERSKDAAFKNGGGLRGVSEVVSEIQAQFERASESGNEVSKMLEAGKVPYHRKNAVYQVSSKMLHVITPLSVVSSQPSTSRSAESESSTEKAGSVYLDFDEDAGMRLGNPSSTLQKLYIWEKKLYDEVKTEEKMRIIHERKCRRLKCLDEKGAEAHKVDSTRTLVRTLSTRIRISIQVVDKISIKINKLRDEELWPQINELIYGLVKMWKAMLECHQSQCQVVTEAKILDAIASNRKFSDAHLEATMQLELELRNWTINFYSWIAAQKGYVKALNGWLLKCLLYEPEETPDGIAPFSPEKEVVEAMQVFTMSLLQLWERHHVDLHQRKIAKKDMDGKVKDLERKEKMMAQVFGEGSGLPIAGQIVNQSDTTRSSLQSCLKHIFEAMERFTTNSMQAYEELRVHSEERLARENVKVP
ncbi:hypothetical protein HHK36_002853 [Tetracentron sinense]|uniref:Nitrate regulatory gene2 protein n=1 Tax=Tetracentron sinense TaxID=13715 RepID=A0A835DNR5_TETSI|nr:hypothetical protein HHK36_002853 [Tetracentron sinense]